VAVEADFLVVKAPDDTIINLSMHLERKPAAYGIKI
jgi:hypothetical protein